MSGEVKVDPAELEAKAAEIRKPMPPAPGEPLPPCELQVARGAVRELNKKAEALRGYAVTGHVEAVRIAESLISAAAAYRQVDEKSGDAIGLGEAAGSIAPVQPGAPMTPPVPLPPDPTYQCPTSPFLMVDQAAAQIEAPDQAASLDAFRGQWEIFAGLLEAESAVFEWAGASWEGGAAEAALEALARHRKWLQEMAEASRQVAGEAGDLAETHRGAAADHPKLAQVKDLDARILLSRDVNEQMQLLKLRQKMQERSEEVLQGYVGKAAGKPLKLPT